MTNERTTKFTSDELRATACRVGELDLTELAERDPIGGEWTQLGLWTVGRPNRGDRVESVVERQCLLIEPCDVKHVYPYLKAIGNAFRCLGMTMQWMNYGEKPEYRYDPVHSFKIGSSNVIGEPVTFRDPRLAQEQFLVNLDLILFFGLEETSPHSGVWRDPRHGNNVLRHVRAEQGDVDVVEVRTRYLLTYLRTRRQALLIGHYEGRRLYQPTPEERQWFNHVDDETIGKITVGRKAWIENRGLETSAVPDDPYLFRRMHLWIVVQPPEIDIDDPWAEEPPFDLTTFTFPTGHGEVAPARWAHFAGDSTAQFAGVSADFMTPVYFRQEVLQKYQGASVFEVLDDGSVVCGHYWSLQQSTSRIGNELLTTAVGDFAQGVPFEEWNHWKQHAVSPPSSDDAERMQSEQTISNAVNEVVDALRDLNDTVRDRAASLGVDDLEDVWRGSLDSLAAKQMKWVYPIGSGDAEFLFRATLASTLVVDGIVPRAIRKLLGASGQGLERKNPTQGGSSTLGSRNLLQRLALACKLADEVSPDKKSMGDLIRKAEAVEPAGGATDLEIELSGCFSEVRRSMRALAFLYDLRTHGGIAHPPSPEKAATAAQELGLPSSGWTRRDYLELLSLVAGSVRMVADTIRP